MKRLIFRDRCANRAAYIYSVPDSMVRWRLTSFMEFLGMSREAAQDAGFVPEPDDELRHAVFRRLVLMPASTLNRPVQFHQNDLPLEMDSDILLPATENIVDLERLVTSECPAPGAVDVSGLNRSFFESCRPTIIELLDTQIDFLSHPLKKKDGTRVHTVAELITGCTELLDHADQVRLLHRIATVVYAAPFENFSRILDGVELRSGGEMWAAMARGYGGVCVEKTAAIRFVCDILGVTTSPVLGSGARIPADIERRVSDYVESEGDIELPIWIQHHLLEVSLPEGSYLLDATNGNMPLLMEDGPDTERRLQAGMRARMVYTLDRVNLRRVSQRTGDLLLTLGEYQVPDLQLQYIFTQGLGLHISSRAFLGVYFDWGGERSALQQNHYARLAKRRGLPFPRFVHAENLGSVPDKNLQHLLAHVLTALRDRYDDPCYTGDFTFVIQPLITSFWTMPRVSASVRRIVES
jgi:hypothetical protein